MTKLLLFLSRFSAPLGIAGDVLQPKFKCKNVHPRYPSASRQVITRAEPGVFARACVKTSLERVLTC